MIKILNRYIAKSIFHATLLAALIVTSVIFLMTTLAEMKNIGEGDYGFIQAILHVLYKLPNEIYQFSPMLILLGSIIGLSVLSAHKELAVMRASGLSIRKISLSVLGTALAIIIVLTYVGEVVSPNLSYKAELRKENERNAGEAVVTASGLWLHIDNNFIHVDHVIDRQLLEGVTRYQFDNERHLQVAYFAKTLSQQNNHWQMNDVVKTTFYPERTRSEAMPKAELDLKINTNLLNLGLYDPNEMSLPKLLKYSRYLEENGLQANEYQYQFWVRVLQPLASLVMVLLAIPFVLGAMSTATTGWRIVAGIMLGFAFIIANALLGQLCIVYQVPALLAALLPIMIFGAVSLLLSNRLHLSRT